MKAFRILITGFFLALAALAFAPASARAQDNDSAPPADSTAPDDNGAPSFDYFYDALQDYGQWIQVEGYGPCWQPAVAANDPNWQPYTDGYWAYTEAGWTWVSYEDFGWITYHYGRWTQVQDAGWVWVPDYQWAPAWVSWRVTSNFNAPDNAAFIGWAPLPPECQFRPGIGISVWVDAAYGIGPGFYSFCRVRDFGAPVLGPVIIDRSKNLFILGSTTNITNITTNNNIIFNGGPSYVALSRRVDPARPIQALHLVRDTDASHFRAGSGGAGKIRIETRGNQLMVPAPVIVPPKHQFKPEKIARTLDKPVINKGWAGVDPKQKLLAQTAIKAQTKGIKLNQPAKPVTAQQLAVIPKGNPASSPVPSPGGKSGGKPFVTPGAGVSPSPSGRPKPKLTPFNPNIVPAPQGITPAPQRKLTTPPSTPNAAANQQEQLQQQQLEEQKAAAEAAVARRQQQTPPPPAPKPTPPPQSFQPRPQGPGPVFPEKGGKPTPTPTPH